MTLPTGITALFDGLPWTHEEETLAIVAVIPFLLVLGWKFLSLRLAVISLVPLLALKIVLFAETPAGGWLVKVTPDSSQPLEVLESYKAGICNYFPKKVPSRCGENRPILNKKGFEEGWLETYATFWNKEASGVLQNPWTDKLAFPLDWALMLQTWAAYDALNPLLKIKGVLLLPKGKKFTIVAEGLVEGSLLATNEKNESFVLSPAKNFGEAAQQKYTLPKGNRWQLSGSLKYAGETWSLIPVLIEENGSVNSHLSRDILWQNNSILSISSGKIQLLKYISWAVDGGICVFFLAWGFWAVRFQVQEQFLTLSLALWSILAILLPIVMAPFFNYVLARAHLRDPTQASHLGMSIVIVAIPYLFWSYFRKDYRNFHPDRLGHTIFLLFGPALLIFFSHRWWFEIEHWFQVVIQDDWTGYQFFARRTAIGGEWLTGGGSSAHGKEMHPYTVAVLHILFGQSGFSMKMLDTWSVLCAAILLAKLAIEFRLTSFVAFITSMLFLMIFLIGGFRYHIGRGLIETLAMILMMLAAWFLFRARGGGGRRIAIATFFAILAYWYRQDHIGVIAGLAFLTLEPVSGPVDGWKGYWARFKIRWNGLLWYWGMGILSMLVLCLRNWFMGAGFVLYHNTPSMKGFSSVLPMLKSYYFLLTGAIWPAYPPISGVIITLGTFLGLIALVRHRKSFFNFPLSIGISLLGLLVPYSFVNITIGYAPRFSIHLLPLALLSLTFFLNYYLKDKPFVLKFNG